MVLRNSAILAFFAVLSLILGIFRDRLLAQIVGVGPMLDVYNAAFRIPDLVYGLLLAAVSAATVVPFITKAAKNDPEELARKFNSLFFFFGFSLVIISIVVSLFLPVLTPYVVPGFDEFQRHYFILCSLILMVQPLFLGLSALVSSLAQVKHRFIVYSIAPLIYTGVIIASIPLLYPRYGVEGIAWGVVVGAILSFLVQSYTLYESRMKLSLSMFSWGHVRAHIRIAIPRSLSTVVSRIRDLVFVAIATSLGVGVLSIYLFAQRIIDAFVQVVVQSAATATLPLLAHKHANGEHTDYARILKLNLTSIFLVSVCAGVVIILFGDTIVHILYGNVAGADDIARMATYFAISLPVYALNIYFVSAFSASKDTMGLFYANLIASSAGVGTLVIASSRGLGIFSLVVGSWVVSIVYLLLLALFYSRKKVPSATL
jgi:putative peptidoglycan lipid II flippase